MAIDSKYGEVTTERGAIGADEPVVVFRAQDRLSIPVLCHYLDLCVQAASPPHHLDALEETIQVFKQWQENNPTQVPRSATPGT